MRDLALLWIFAAVCGVAQSTSDASQTPPVSVTGAVIARICYPSIIGNDPAPQTEFLTTDSNACILLNFRGGKKGDKLRIEWINPFGTVMSAATLEQSVEGGSWFWTTGLLIAGKPPSFAPGNWQVRLFDNGVGIVVLPFRISVPPSGRLQLAGSTALPRSTVGVPYWYRFTVRGGEAPIHWAVSGALPPGLSLSDDGVLSGIPSKHSGHQFTVAAQDQAGNTLSRVIAMGVALRPKTPVLVRGLTAYPLNDSPCGSGPITTTFSSRQDVALDFTIGGGNADRLSTGTAAVEWLNPSGDIAFTTEVHKKTDGEECFRQSLPLPTRAEVQPGEWRARVIWAWGEATSVSFTVVSTETTTHDSGVVARRWALVIGNTAYRHLPAIPSAGKDVDLLESALRANGFDVTAKRNLTIEDLKRTEHDFMAKVQKGGVAVVYYAGYGVHEGPENWLLPIGYDPGDRRQLSTKAYSVSRLLQLLEEKEVKLKILFLNAGWPATALASGGQQAGLGAMEVDRQTVISLVASPNRGAAVTSSDSASGFARALVNVMSLPNAGVQQLDVELRKAMAANGSDVMRPVTLMNHPEEFRWRAEEDSQRPK